MTPRYVRLRRFVAWSLLVHAGAGIGWGVPAWLKQREASEAAAAQKARAESAAREEVRALERAKAESLEATRAEVEGQLKAQFDKMTEGLPEEMRGAAWKEIAKQMEEGTRGMARALGNREISEQDLRNLQAQLQRELVERVEKRVQADSAEVLSREFLAAVERDLGPDLGTMLREAVKERIAPPLRQHADKVAGELGKGETAAKVKGELRRFGAGDLKEATESGFAVEFRTEALPKLTQMLKLMFQEKMDANDLTDPAMAGVVAGKAGSTLATVVPEVAQAGEQVAQRFADLAPEGAAGEVKDAKLDEAKLAMTVEAKSLLHDMFTKKSLLKVLDETAAKGRHTGVKGLGSGGGGATLSVIERIGRLAAGVHKGRAELMIGTGGQASLSQLRANALKRDPLGRHGSGPADAGERVWVEDVTDRGVIAGSEWERRGASGEVSRGKGGVERLPARVAGADNAGAVAETKNTAPYQPTFKSLAFAAIPYLPADFVIDGKREKWEKVPGIALKPEGEKGAAGVPEMMQMGWRPDGLYMCFTIADPDKKIDKTTVNQFWDGDTVEVWVDCLNAKEKRRSRHAGQQFWVWPEGSVDDATLMGGESIVVKRDGDYSSRTFHADQLPRATTKGPDGYIMEFRLPADLLVDADLVPGRILGLNAYVTTMGINKGGNWYWSAGKSSQTFAWPDTWGDVLLAGSDATLEVGERGHGEKATKAEVLAPGQALKLRVIDGDMNLSPIRRDKVLVTLKPAHGGQQIAVLEEMGAATGVFEGSVSTALAVGDDQPGVLAVYEGELVEAVYLDQARANGARDAQLSLKVRFGAAMTKRLGAEKR